jgi:ornithine carbamoyltransferase
MTRAAAARAGASPLIGARDERRSARSFLSVADLDADQLEHCLALAARLKRERSLGACAPTSAALSGRHVALLFDKPSLRTRTTFEVAVRELGAHAIALPAEVALGAREPVADVARNLERWVHAVVIRTFGQAVIEEFAAAAPALVVINALTDQEHPCQALADFLTLREHAGDLRGQTLAFVGDGNNVATSLVHAGLMLGVTVHVASPPGYVLPDAVVQQARRLARHGAELRLFADPQQAVRGAVAVYTDVWTSMGQEAELAERKRAFARYRVDSALMAHAGREARFMHCLPAHRDEEVTSEVFDSPASIVFDQAENRLHTQKALLLSLLAPQYA